MIEEETNFLLFRVKTLSLGKLVMDAVKICIPSEGKVLAALHDGGLSCEEPSKESRDEHWLFVKTIQPPALVFPDAEIIDTSDGYNIVSANFKLVMDYNPSTGEQVSVVPYNEIDRTHTIWHVTENDEIYTYDRDGNRKYLWSALGNVYVTADEHLAENWKAVSLEGYDAPLAENYARKDERGAFYIILLFLIILIALIYLFIIRRRR